VKETAMRRLFSIFLLSLVMSTQHACSEDRMVFHSLGYQYNLDSPGTELIDCLYGEMLGKHTRHEVETGQARRGECFKGGGTMPMGDFLYVKWRDKATGKEYEDRVDLKSRLPSPKDMFGQTVYFLVDDNQLFVYLIPDSDIEGKRNHLPPGKPANGPDGWDYLDVKTLYPDNSPPKVRGGNVKWRAQRDAAKKKEDGQP
jgi:hypothetical protein